MIDGATDDQVRDLLDRHTARMERYVTLMPRDCAARAEPFAKWQKNKKTCWKVASINPDPQDFDDVQRASTCARVERGDQLAAEFYRLAQAAMLTKLRSRPTNASSREFSLSESTTILFTGGSHGRYQAERRTERS